MAITGGYTKHLLQLLNLDMEVYNYLRDQKRKICFIGVVDKRRIVKINYPNEIIEYDLEDEKLKHVFKKID